MLQKFVQLKKYTSISQFIFIPYPSVLLPSGSTDFHKKEDRIRVLQQKAASRNPDEFYFGMVNVKTVVCAITSWFPGV